MNKSIYKYAAEAGIPVGLYLSAMSASLFLSLNYELFNTILFLLIPGFPVMLWYRLRRIATEEPSYMKFSALWLGGIYTVIFGTLICSLLSGIYLMFIHPGFVGEYVLSALSTIESSPSASEYAVTTDMMHEALEAHMLPSGMEFVSTMGWLTCFIGSLLSLISAYFISRAGRRRKNMIMGN